MTDPEDWIGFALAQGIGSPARAEAVLRTHSAVAAEQLKLAPGAMAVVSNGRVIPAEPYSFTAPDFELLQLFGLEFQPGQHILEARPSPPRFSSPCLASLPPLPLGSVFTRKSAQVAQQVMHFR